MSLAEIKAEIAKLTPDEVAELKRELARDPLDDPQYVAEMAWRVREMEAGRHVVTRDEVLNRARELGIDL
ncbi:MAG: hypothetical protein ABMA13_17405 [Chthoniobacteraceae bacterium]